MPERLSRKELYDLVWSEPMKTLAPRFGISDVALKKTCAKAAIPVPQRGYWAKRQAGKKTLQSPLPLRPPGLDDEVIVASRGRYWYGLTAKELLGPLPEPPLFHEPIEAVRERVRKQMGKITVPKIISKAHPVIDGLLEEDEQRTEKQHSSSYTYSWEKPLFDSPLERRRLRILNGLFLAVARAGGKAWVRPPEAREFGVTVQQRQVPLKLDRLPQKHRRSRNGSSSQEEVSNRLRLSILTGCGSQNERIAWEDDDTAELERRMGEIAAEVITTAEVQYRECCVRSYEWRVQRKAQVEEEVRHRKTEAERKERERQARLAEERVNRLLGEAASLRQANDIRAYVDAVRVAATGTDALVQPKDLETWCMWALAQADRIDPIKSGAFLKSTGTALGDASEA